MQYQLKSLSFAAVALVAAGGMTVAACHIGETNGRRSDGGAGGAGGAGAVGGASTGGPTNTGVDVESPCPTGSVECCEALDQVDCDIFGDECRWIAYTAAINEACDAQMSAGCFFVDAEKFSPEYTDTGTHTGTGVGANSKMWRTRDDGVNEAVVFPYFYCGTLYGWFGCGMPGSPPVCNCVQAYGC